MNVDDDSDFFGPPPPPPAFLFAAPPPPEEQAPPAPPAEAAAPAPPPPATLAQAAANAFIGAHNVLVTAAAVLCPLDAVLLNHPIMGHNPQLDNQMPMETPPVNADGRNTIQRADGTLPNTCVTVPAMLEHLHPTQLEFMRDNWNEIMILCFFLGGNTLFSRYANILSDAKDAMSGYLGMDKVELYAAVPDGEAITGSYGGPKIAIAHFTHPNRNSREGLKMGLAAQRTFRCTPQLGWIMVDLEEAVGIMSQTLGSWGVPSSGGDVAFFMKFFLAGIRKLLYKTPALVQIINRQSQSLSNDNLQTRLDSFVWSISMKYFPHPTDAIITAYAPPLTTNPADHEALGKLIRALPIFMGPFSFAPKAYTDEAPECIICPGDDHFQYLCPYSDESSWGPTTKISNHTDGVLARGRGRGGWHVVGARGRGGPGRGRGGRGRGAAARGRGAPTRGGRGGNP